MDDPHHGWFLKDKMALSVEIYLCGALLDMPWEPSHCLCISYSLDLSQIM